MSSVPPSPAPVWREFPNPEPDSRGFARIQVWRPSRNVVRVQVMLAERGALRYWDQVNGERDRVETVVRSGEELAVLCSCIDAEASAIARLLWEWQLTRYGARLPMLDGAFAATGS